MFHKILVAIDGSAYADAALNLATGLAETHGAQLGLVYAYPHITGVFGVPNFDELLAGCIRDGEAMLEAAQRQLPAGVISTLHLLEGPPAQAILRVAQAEGYDLIVLGSRGRGQVSGLLLGSVSSVVAQRAPCHVLIAHGQPHMQHVDRPAPEHGVFAVP